MGAVYEALDKEMKTVVASVTFTRAELIALLGPLIART
jgi:hypothetical protein